MQTLKFIFGWIGLAILLFTIGIVVLIWTQVSKPSYKAKNEALREYTGIKWVVTSGHNEKSLDTFPLALENDERKVWKTFDPCTSEQFNLRSGNEVIFSYSNERLGESTDRTVDYPECYLRIVSVNGDNP